MKKKVTKKKASSGPAKAKQSSMASGAKKKATRSDVTTSDSKSAIIAADISEKYRVFSLGSVVGHDENETYELFYRADATEYIFIILIARESHHEIRQLNIPRYRVAVAAQAVKDHPGEASVYRPMELTQESGNAYLGLAMRTAGHRALVYHSVPFIIGADTSPVGIVFDLKGARGEKLNEYLNQDLDTLETAKGVIKNKNAHWIFPGGETPMGRAAIGTDRQLLEAIAFEREARGYLAPEDFGVYSAYCTFADFGDRVESSVIADLPLRSEHAGYTIDKDVDIAKMATMVKALTRPQKALCALCFGMHFADPLVALPFVRGELDCQEYAHHHSQPHFAEHLDTDQLRSESAAMQLFRDMMAKQDLSLYGE